MHDATILGSINIGNQEITSVYDEVTDCTVKSSLHSQHLFEVGESVKLDTEESAQQSKIIKLNMSEKIYTEKCNNGNPQDDFQMTSIEFKENIVLLDAKVRGINLTKHIREITLIDFSDHDFGDIKKRIVFEGLRFEDEGINHDLVAHDGIYTSIEVFNNGNKFSSLQSGGSERVLSNPIVDFQFKHQISLQSIIDYSNSDPDIPQGFNFNLHCDVEFGTNGCEAANLGWCTNCCATISNCNFDIGWSSN